VAEIFLSYAREDSAKAELLANALENQDWCVYWDRTSILPGQDVDEVIEQAIDHAKCMIVIWSTASKQSHWVKGEAGIGLEQNKLLQIYIENMVPPIKFRGHHNEDFCQWLGDASDARFKKLCLAVKSFVGEPSSFVNHPFEREPSIFISHPSPETSTELSSVTTNCLAFEPEMVIIPKGSFQMGSNKNDREQPIHTVTIPKQFAMGKYPVIFAEYDYFAKQIGKDKPDDEGWGRENRPVINVSWQDACDYAVWLSEQTGKRYRLPSEAEWEYAIRAGSKGNYYWGDADEPEKYCWFDANSKDQTQLVGQKNPNAFGLYDMAGNVWEWLQDTWHENYRDAPAGISPWIDGGDASYRVLHGGSWYNALGCLRSASRTWGEPSYRNYFFGFRLAQDLP